MTNNVIRGPWGIAHQVCVSECSFSRCEPPAPPTTRGSVRAIEHLATMARPRPQGFQKLGDVMAGIVAKLAPTLACSAAKCPRKDEGAFLWP